MYRLHANGVFLDVLERDQVTSGSAKVFKCRFTFDGPYWDDLNRTAVFRAYNPRSQAAVEVIREVALDRDGLCEIPWEVTKIKNRLLAVGVYGTKTDGTILPTIWVDLDEILPGATAGEATKPPTPDKYQQFVQQVQADAARAEAAAKAADASVTQAAASAEQAAASASAAQGSLRNVQNAASKALSDINAGKNTALEAITHRKEDALAAVDQAKTDATGDVQTAKQEAVAAITHTGTDQIQAVTRAGEQAVKEVDAAAQAGVGSVEQTKQTATQAVQTAATAAIQRVEQTGSTQVQAVTAAGAGQVKKIEDAAAEKLEGITQLAGQATDSATKAEQAAQRAEDAAAAMSAIIDDTVIADSKTWSSKGIVDTLCPPIQATGNPVVCHPVEGYPLGVTVNFAPIQEGEGDPSPESVRPIKPREAVDVTRCGVNLCPYGTQTFARYYWKPFGYFLPSGTYTFSATVKSDDQDYENCLVHFYDTKNNKSVKTEMIKRNIRTSIKVSVPGKFDAIYLYSSIGAIESSGKSATFSDIQLEIEATPSAFAPYTGQTTTLTLPTPCYGGELDAVSGRGRETWKVIELVGTEDWLSWGVDFKTPGITGFYAHSINDYDPGQRSLTLCSHTLYSTSVWGGQNTGVGFSGSSPLYLILSVKNDLLADTSSTAAAIDSLKAYLAAQYAAGTPVTVAYIKSTPTPITATGGKPIPALAGTNTMLTDGDALTVTGREDIVHALAEMSRSVTQNAQVVDAMLGISPLAEGKNDQKGE